MRCFFRFWRVCYSGFQKALVGRFKRSSFSWRQRKLHFPLSPLILLKKLLDGFRLSIAIKEYTLNACFYLWANIRMGQAKTFTTEEFDAVLSFVAKRRHALRNRMMILMSFWAGMRVGEIAALRVSDVVDGSGKIKGEVRLGAAQTKGNHARTVFLPQKLRDELQRYVDTRGAGDRLLPLFLTAGGKRFSANVLTQHFFWLYRKAGIEGASSHSGRRSFITNLASKGIGVRVLASLAGHRSIAVTQKYIDVNDEMKRNAVELV